MLVPLAALSLAACGDDDDDEPSDTTTEVTRTTAEETEATTSDSGSVEAEDTLPGGITIPDLTLPEGVTLPSIAEGDVVDTLMSVFPDLSEEQATCLVDALDLGSGDMPDLSNLSTGLLDDCNINVRDLIPG